MAICNNCFNGCTQTTPDKCVKYTGVSVPSLNITSGDSLYSVVDNLIDYLLTALNGTGIVPTIESSYICDLIYNYLPASPTAVDLFTALIRATCDLETSVNGIAADIAVIEGDYTIGTCLDDVTASSGTHDILQAVIYKLCSVSVDVTALAANFINYVQIADINTYIAAYLAATNASTKHYTKMVPYTVVEYYGDLTGKFDLTGAGYGDWEKIYLCNGQNGTPDKRGRIPVGATTMGATAFNAVVDPAISGNPTYALNTLYGANTITLSEAEMPSHTHVASSVVTDGGHTHFTVKSTYEEYPIANDKPIKSEANVDGGNYDYRLNGALGSPDLGITSVNQTGITVSTSNADAGSDTAHSNIPPVYACYYLMYVPS